MGNLEHSNSKDQCFFFQQFQKFFMNPESSQGFDGFFLVLPMFRKRRLKGNNNEIQTFSDLFSLNQD